MKHTLPALLIGLLCAGCASVSPPDSPLVPAVSPDSHLIFHNGVILTMNPDQSEAEAISIAGEKIEAVGSNANVLALRRPDTAIINLQGQTLMPGFVDPHSHIFNDAEQYLDMTVIEAQQVALENGITTLGDLYVTEEFLEEMQELDRAGQLQIRTNLYLVMTDPCGDLQGDWWQEYPPAYTPGERLRIGGVKIFTDGGVCEDPALSYELEPGKGLGSLYFTQEELDGLVAKAQAHGFQVVMHACGDRAVEQAQNAIAAALGGQPNPFRHRIDHNCVIRPELLARYGEIGILPIVFGPYAVCEPFGPPPPAEYQAWEWPWRALLDANPGLPVAWHGDDPFFGRIRPLDDLYSLVTRNEVGEDGRVCESPAWQKAHTITVAEALPMMTINAAYALFRDEEVGSLEPGKYADLIVLTHNPLTITPEALKDVNVVLTMIGGRVAYCAARNRNLCPPLEAQPQALESESAINQALAHAGAGMKSNAEWQALYSAGFIQEFDGVEMVLVPAGCFQMGNDSEGIGWDGDSLEQGIPDGGRLCFDEPFWIDRTEVTQGDFARFDGTKLNENAFDGDNRPVENITWLEARDFCRRRGARLPTEAEWEYAARGVDGLIFPWGNDFVGENTVWNRSPSQGTADVAGIPAGASWVGSMDMAGNVWEWVNSLHKPYPYNADDGREDDSEESSELQRIQRGSSWFGNLTVLQRATVRGQAHPSIMADIWGFRCARAVD